MLHVPDNVFLARYAEALDDCRSLVMRRGAEGRNVVISISEMFPRGAKDVTFMLYMKAARALSESEIDNERKVREELEDIINYAAFGLAWLTLHAEQAATELSAPIAEKQSG